MNVYIKMRCCFLQLFVINDFAMIVGFSLKIFYIFLYDDTTTPPPPGGVNEEIF